MSIAYLIKYIQQQGRFEISKKTKFNTFITICFK